MVRSYRPFLDVLTLNRLGEKSADIWNIFSYFSQKTGLTIHANCHFRRNVKVYFLGKIRNSNLSPAESAYTVVKVRSELWPWREFELNQTETSVVRKCVGRLGSYFCAPVYWLVPVPMKLYPNRTFILVYLVHTNRMLYREEIYQNLS